MKENKKDLIEVCRLWENDLQGGGTYMSSEFVGRVRFMLFKNGFKTEPKHPDWVLYVCPARRHKKDGEGDDGGEETPF
jgi:hypothetical protein